MFKEIDGHPNKINSTQFVCCIFLNFSRNFICSTDYFPKCFLSCLCAHTPWHLISYLKLNSHISFMSLKQTFKAIFLQLKHRIQRTIFK